MKADWQQIQALLVDPTDRTPLSLSDDGDQLVSVDGTAYPIEDGQPILLPVEGLVSGGWRFEPIGVAEAERPKPARPLSKVLRAFKRGLRRVVSGQGARGLLVDLLGPATHGPGSRALVVGGATVGEGSRPLVEAPGIAVISFDVYPTPSTTFVADGHQIPLVDSCVSAVWIQAVLEHVYRPEDVVGEIVRVLEPGGLVYAETPFLQPVHEGAFDYVRFNQSGHRLLFSRFDQIAAGPLGGPAAVCQLGIRGVVGGLTRSANLARVAYVVTLPLVLLDRLIPESWRVDYSTGTYFLGRLSDAPVRAFDPVGTYRGAGRTSRIDEEGPT